MAKKKRFEKFIRGKINALEAPSAPRRHPMASMDRSLGDWFIGASEVYRKESTRLEQLLELAPLVDDGLMSAGEAMRECGAHRRLVDATVTHMETTNNRSQRRERLNREMHGLRRHLGEIIQQYGSPEYEVASYRITEIESELEGLGS